MRSRQRNAEQRIRPKILFVLAPVELDQLAINRFLIERIGTREALRDGFIDRTHGFRNALAAVALLVAIAQFPRFMLARAGAARNRRAPECAALQVDIDFNGRIAARIKNLARVDFTDAGFRHRSN